MAQKFKTIEEIDNHIAQHEQELAKGKVSAANFCSIYKVAKPILEFASTLLFFKPKWQGILKSLLAVLDTQCK